MTEEQIRTHIEKAYREYKEPEKSSMVYQYCLNEGWVERGGIGLNVCNNSECASCRFMVDIFRKVVDEN